MPGQAVKAACKQGKIKMLKYAVAYALAALVFGALAAVWLRWAGATQISLMDIARGAFATGTTSALVTLATLKLFVPSDRSDT